MSRVTAINNQQHEPYFVDHISQLLKNSSFKDLHTTLKNITLVNLYNVYNQLPKTEQAQLLNKLPIVQKIDLTLLSNRSQPVIELLQPDQLQVVDIKNTVISIKSKLQKQSNAPIVVVDEFNRYLGIVELHHLIDAPDNDLIESYLSDVTKLHVSEQQQNAAQIIANNNDHYAVVVDKQEHLVGILNLSDIINISTIKEKKPTERPYLQVSVLNHVRQRIFWILALAVVGLLSGIIIQSYDDAITALIILAFYMPMVADTGGNAGSQAATVIIRSIAMGELKLQNWFAILYKEMRIAIFIGLGLGIVSYFKIYFLSYGIELPEGLTLTVIAFAIGLAIFIQVLTATVIGASLPLFVKWCKQDPAVVASPAITTIVDITGLLIYFYITSTILLY